MNRNGPLQGGSVLTLCPTSSTAQKWLSRWPLQRARVILIHSFGHPDSRRSRAGMLQMGSLAQTRYLFGPDFLPFRVVPQWPRATCQMFPFGQAHKRAPWGHCRTAPAGPSDQAQCVPTPLFLPHSHLVTNYSKEWETAESRLTD